VSPGTTGVTPGLAGVSPGTTGVTPGLAGVSPGTPGVTPGVAGAPPGTTGVTPGLAGVSPGTTGVTPGVADASLLRNASSTAPRAPTDIDMKTAIHRTLVALKLPEPIGLLIGVVKAILIAMTGNKQFQNPTPALPTVATALSDLENAQAAAQSRVKGATETRNAKRAALLLLVDALASYVKPSRTPIPKMRRRPSRAQRWGSARPRYALRASST
jgi:hypothetical protein